MISKKNVIHQVANENLPMCKQGQFSEGIIVTKVVTAMLLLGTVRRQLLVLMLHMHALVCFG
jgi:hypothetical protein